MGNPLDVVDLADGLAFGATIADCRAVDEARAKPAASS